MNTTDETEMKCRLTNLTPILFKEYLSTGRTIGEVIGNALCIVGHHGVSQGYISNVISPGIIHVQPYKEGNTYERSWDVYMRDETIRERMIYHPAMVKTKFNESGLPTHGGYTRLYEHDPHRYTELKKSI